MGFEWDDAKDIANTAKHHLSFYEAQEAFFDKKRLVLTDNKHSLGEKRHFCIGKTTIGGIATVVFTTRGSMIRIISAGYWRKGKKLYEKHNQLH